MTDVNIWKSTFGNIAGCPELNKYSLWWMPDAGEFDGMANFNSYNQIGGWKIPYMKFYKESTICGQSLWENYYV